MKALIVPVIVALLSGCASVHDIEGDELGSAFQEHVATPPATTYRHLLTLARECYSDKAYRVQGEFYPDTNSARVAAESADGSIGFFSASISPAGANGTLMKVRYYDAFKLSGAEAEWRSALVPWANGKKGYCAADAFRPRPKADPSRP